MCKSSPNLVKLQFTSQRRVHPSSPSCCSVFLSLCGSGSDPTRPDGAAKRRVASRTIPSVRSTGPGRLKVNAVEADRIIPAREIPSSLGLFCGWVVPSRARQNLIISQAARVSRSGRLSIYFCRSPSFLTRVFLSRLRASCIRIFFLLRRDEFRINKRD